MTKEQLIIRAKEALERVRYLRTNRLLYGVDTIHLSVSDVEGDWLENWKLEDEN